MMRFEQAYSANQQPSRRRLILLQVVSSSSVNSKWPSYGLIKHWSNCFKEYSFFRQIKQALCLCGLAKGQQVVFLEFLARLIDPFKLHAALR